MGKTHPLKPFYDVIDTGNPKEKWERLPEFPRIIELEMGRQSVTEDICRRRSIRN